ncbi:hypothetical protein RhiirA4_125725 [Rhizophagus irregularis]|uniref:Uncharacterized protein n=1 Tax=Rhizophagus irregularis TaxID=588596 RepID=A0A2I1HFZ1_9GLOM|nr:hypothetical protein RhiirA4_125725 [Rhizophagus irregularis]
MSILERCSICTSNRIKIWLEPIQMALLENYASNLSKGASNNASNLPRAHHWMYGMDLSRRSTRTYLESYQCEQRRATNT